MTLATMFCHFSVSLVSSTNIHPHELADEAFLRRLGYKIQFSTILKVQFAQIWKNVCAERKITVEEGVLEWVFDSYEQTKRPFLPCQPRDLIDIGLDMAAFNNNKGVLSKANIMLAWNTYFIDL